MLRHDPDHGEAEAIALAIERKASLLLLDDSEKARLYHLTFTGTAGLLLRAYREGMLVSLGETLDELESSGFSLHTNSRENF